MFLAVACISLASTALSITLSLAFKIAGKLRLTLPLVYFLAGVISSFFVRWTDENEALFMMGLYILVGLVALSWIYSIVKKIRSRAANAQREKCNERFALLQVEQAREKGILPDHVLFDSDGTLLDADTGKPVF